MFLFLTLRSVYHRAEAAIGEGRGRPLRPCDRQGTPFQQHRLPGGLKASFLYRNSFITGNAKFSLNFYGRTRNFMSSGLLWSRLLGPPPTYSSCSCALRVMLVGKLEKQTLAMPCALISVTLLILIRPLFKVYSPLFKVYSLELTKRKGGLMNVTVWLIL